MNLDQPLLDAEYLKLGRQLADLLGASLDGRPAAALRAASAALCSVRRRSLHQCSSGAAH